MKVGTEVEGRLKGVKTLFMDSVEFLAMLRDEAHDSEAAYAYMVTQITDLAHKHAVHQIYISDHYNAINLDFFVLSQLSREFVVTLEVTGLVKAPPSHVNVLLAVKNPYVWLLKSTDQIKFSQDMSVMAVAVEAMHKTIPADFAGDKEI